MVAREKDTPLARKGRLVGLVIAGTMLIWLAVQMLGPRLGLPPRFVFLFDFAALAAFFWAMVVVYQMWQVRQDEKK
ncbi:DUF5337 family protein [Sulfitobacter aestuariivivens]|uniref:DUF5337 domain-containing protein n=1 Tax=Sulfitobacter aestuariivivens TaxID=2766981 RepID=A0A927D5E5_9RHOB|nr:DUF5337 domain-containing protein [Sulfitobacter aestuariivivens]